MAKPMTEEEGLKRLEEKCGHFLDIKRTKFKGTQTNVESFCLKHNHPINSNFQNLTRKKNPTECPDCRRMEQAEKQKTDPKIAMKQLDDKYKGSTLSFEFFKYDTSKGESIVYCTECENKFLSSHDKLMSKKYSTCDYCTGIKKTKQGVRDELNALYEGKISFDEFDYVKNDIKSIAICLQGHGAFLTSYSIVTNKNTKYACPDCANEHTGDYCKLTQEEAIERIDKAQCRTLDLDNFIYTDAITNSECTCLICNTKFLASYANLTNSTGVKKCPTCSRQHTANLRKPTQTQAWETIHEKKGEEFEISYFRYVDSFTNVHVKCKVCQTEGVKTYVALVGKKDVGCVPCNQSKGEKRVKKYLESIKEEYEREVSYPECKWKRKMPFDFYLPQYDLLIEYQGEFHYNAYPPMFTEEKLGVRQVKDKIKKEYAETHHKFLEIPYWEFKNIEKILKETIEGLDKLPKIKHNDKIKGEIK